MFGQTKPGLKLVLTGLILLTVLLTALLVHALWSYTARQNVEDVVDQLNQEIVTTVKNELAGVRDVLTKAYGSTNAVNLVKATLDGALRLRSKETVAALRGVEIK